MADNKRIARDLIAGAAMAIGLTLVSGGHVAADGPNEVSYWCGTPQDGVKFESPATPFVVPEAPDGYTWTLLVVKAGSDDDGDGAGNDVPIVDPIVGQSYAHSTGKSNSHVILCKDLETTTTVPGTTTTTTVLDTTTTTTVPGLTVVTTVPDTEATTTTEPGATTTTVGSQSGPTTTVGSQAGPTTTIAQSSGASTTTVPVTSTLPATGASDLSRNLTLIALLLVGVGAVMLRMKPKSIG